MKTNLIRLIITVLVVYLNPNIYSYQFKGNKWIGGETTIYADIPGISNSGIAWNAAFLGAALEWNAKTVFDLKVLPIYRDPCIADGLNTGILYLMMFPYLLLIYALIRLYFRDKKQT